MSENQTKNNQDVDEWWENEQQKNKTTGKWYDNKILVVFLFIAFFPIGLYGLLKSKSFSKGIKVAGTLLVIIGLIAFLNSNDSDLQDAVNKADQTDQVQREIELSPPQLVDRYNEALSIVGKDYQLYMQEEIFENDDEISYLALPEGEEFMRMLINVDRSTDKIKHINIIHDSSLLNEPSKTKDDHLVAAILTIEGLEVSDESLQNIYNQLTDFVDGNSESDRIKLIDRDGFRFTYSESDKLGPLGIIISFDPIQRSS